LGSNGGILKFRETESGCAYLILSNHFSDDEYLCCPPRRLPLRGRVRQWRPAAVGQRDQARYTHKTLVNCHRPRGWFERAAEAVHRGRGALSKLHAGLTGERPSFKDAEDAATSLAERIERKNCLVVINYVWDPAHLEPFLRGGAGSARLITSRLLQVATLADHTGFVSALAVPPDVRLTSGPPITTSSSGNPPAPNLNPANCSS
jgi:hypothetical protein